MYALDVAVSITATIPRPSVKAVVSASAVAGQKKSWGVGARYQEQLGAQKPKTGAATAVSKPPTGVCVCVFALSCWRDFESNLFLTRSFTLLVVRLVQLLQLSRQFLSRL